MAREYLAASPERVAGNPEIRQWLDAFADLRRKREAAALLGGRLVLTCWCRPLACHGDVLKLLLEELDQ
jgi:hypothetical protein